MQRRSKFKKIGGLNLLELYHGPTLAFKDIAMQVIGLLFSELEFNKKKLMLSLLHQVTLALQLFLLLRIKKM